MTRHEFYDTRYRVFRLMYKAGYFITSQGDFDTGNIAISVADRKTMNAKVVILKEKEIDGWIWDLPAEKLEAKILETVFAAALQIPK